MNKLKELIQKFCPDGVAHVSLETVCKIEKGVQFNRKDMHDKGSYPVINGGINPSGYIEQYNQNENTITISQGGASAGYVNWLETKFWAGAHCYVLKPTSKVLNRYLFHFLKSREYKLQDCQYGAGIPALGKSTVASLEIPLPPIEVQRKIVSILDCFTTLAAELESELTARKKQYEYYLDTIMLSNKEAKKVVLSNVCEIYDGTHQTPKYTKSGVKFVSVENIDDLYGTKKFISEEDFEKYKVKPQINDVLMTRITAGIIGKCTVVDRNEPLAYYVSLALLRPKADVLDSKYLKYYIESGYGKRELRRHILTDATPPKINKDAIGKVFVLLPDIHTQRRIVALAENFDIICNDRSTGLPAEIEARQKQYEYYRDKLLTFNEVSQC